MLNLLILNLLILNLLAQIKLLTASTSTLHPSRLLVILTITLPTTTTEIIAIRNEIEIPVTRMTIAVEDETQPVNALPPDLLIVIPFLMLVADLFFINRTEFYLILFLQVLPPFSSTVFLSAYQSIDFFFLKITSRS